MNQENTTNSTTDNLKKEKLLDQFNKPTIDINNMLSPEEIIEKRKLIKDAGIDLINETISIFTQLLKENVTFDKIDYLNMKIYSCFMLLDINSSKLVASNKNDLSKIDGDSITHEQALAIYELGLWKRVNDYLEQDPTLNFIDSMHFLRDIKQYILNMYKDLN